MKAGVTGSHRWGGGRRRLAVWAGAAGLMVLPVLAMRGVEGLARDPGDLAFLAILLAGTGIAYELAENLPNQLAYRAGVGLALAATVLLVWINLAVGIIGNEGNPGNLIYAGVLVVAITGALGARLKPRGMARAMVATAIAQLLAFVVALVCGFGFTGPITLFFVTLWLSAARLFGKAGRA